MLVFGGRDETQALITNLKRGRLWPYDNLISGFYAGYFIGRRGLVNKSSLPFVLKAKGQREITLSPMSQQNLMIKGDTMNFTVENMWHGADSRLSVCIIPQKR